MKDNWTGKNSLFHLEGEKHSFKCECGCNVFTRNKRGDKAKCNGCGLVYETEKEKL